MKAYDFLKMIVKNVVAITLFLLVVVTICTALK